MIYKKIVHVETRLIASLQRAWKILEDGSIYLTTLYFEG